MSAPGAPGASDADRLARVALSQLAEPGDLRMAGLVAELGAPRLFELLAEQRDPLSGLLTDLAERFRVLEPERDLEHAYRAGSRFVVPGDAEWPVQVDDLEAAESVDDVGRAPLGLWVRGPVRLDELAGAVAVVGSRSATTYGADTAGEIAAAVARAQRPVISGAAYGIDIAAHRGAVAAGGVTVAVLACGVDRAYPADHRLFFDYLLQEGAIVSEVAPGRAPLRPRFLSRNRVIAALCAGTVLVEAAARSGATNTANWTTRLHRPLMAVPGPVTSATSIGPHEQIRRGAATLVTSGADVLELVGEAGTHLVDPPRGPERPRDRLTKRHRQVLEAVPVGSSVPTDAIARTAGLGLREVRATLTVLERMGMTREGHDGWRLAAAARDHGDEICLP